MMRKLLFSSLLAAQCLMSGESSLSLEHQQFALDFYAKTQEMTSENNVIFSPYSVATALSMLYVGSRGETADEIGEVLHTQLKFSEMAKASLDLNNLLRGSNPQLKIANSLWTSQDVFLLSSYKEVIEKSFLAQLDRLDFSAPEKATEVINGWIKKETSGKIPAILEKGDLDKDSKLVLVQTLFLQGAWKFPFRTDNTSEGIFHPTEDRDVTLAMMEGSFSIPYYENDLLQMIALPLDQSTVECVCLLPKSEKNADFLTEELSANLNDWILGFENKKVKVKLPKSSIRQRLDLQKLLEDLGMKQAFTTQANFLGIDGKLDLFVSKVITEAVLSLDEKGIEAAASTAIGMGLTSIGAPDVAFFIADHPFIILLRDRQTQEILFLGKVVNPQN